MKQAKVPQPKAPEFSTVADAANTGSMDFSADI
jgi:hypothetical protein